jgi:cyclopropane-fatty-acyl-phospholipid synthase
MPAAPPSQLYLGASRDAIRRHYDLSNDFYALWLDPTMTYSCALWGPGDDLAAAQLRKLDHLLDAANTRGAARVLDVGCGWGGLLRRATERHGVGHAVGLTLSERQAAWLARRRPAPAVEVRVENWSEHRPRRPYDAIISVGAMEHFARFGLPRPARVESYRRFFAFCRAALPAGARLVVQTNVKGNNRLLSRQTVAEMAFVIESVFPESEIPALVDLVEASEKRFEVLGIRNDAHDYVRTCQEWLRRLRSRRDDAVGIVGEGVVADYERFLGAFVEQFRQRHLGLSLIHI